MSRVVSFGEILWDKLPSGKVPGGAPLNFAYRLNSFENSLSIISKVGDDSLGKGLTEFLKQKRSRYGTYSNLKNLQNWRGECFN